MVDTGAFNTNQITLLSTVASKQLVSLTATTGDLTLGAAIGNSVDDLTLVATAGNIVGGATATADALTLNAGQGIGIGTAVTADATSYSLTTAGAGTDGNITLVDVGALNTTQITTLATHTSAQTISLTATTGNLTVGNGIGDATDNLTLIAIAGDVDGGATATAETLTVNASGGIGNGTALMTDANTLSLVTSGFNAAGNITVIQADAANLSVATDGSAQTIDVTLTTGDFTLGGTIGDASDSLSFTAAGGDIVGGGTVTANTLTLNASGGIGIGTAVTANATTYHLTTLGADAAGNITLVDTGAFNTNQIATLSTAASVQTISLTATTGDLTVGAAIGNATDNLALIASAGDVIGGATATAATLTVNADGGIGIGIALNTNADTLNLTSGGAAANGNITVIQASAANLSVDTAATGQTVDVTVSAGDLTISGPVGDANDDVNLTIQSGNVVGGSFAVTADTLTIDASGGIGIGVELDTDADTLDLTTHGVAVAGNISIVQADAANFSIATDTSGQTISVTLTTGDFTVGGAIGDGNDSLTFIANDGNIVGGGTVTANDLTLSASGGIGIGTAVTANAATYSLTTTGIGTDGNIRLVDTNGLNTNQITTLSTHSSTQTISLTASTGNLTVESSIGDANDHLSLISTLGNVDGGATATAATLTLNAGGGIGIGAALTVDATSYSLTTAGAGTAGNINLVDANALNTNEITTLVTDGSVQTIHLTASAGDLTTGSAIGNNSDHLTLTTLAGNVEGGATVTADTLTVNSSGGIGILTAFATDVNTLNLTTDGIGAAGDISVIQADASNLSIATDASAQTISVTLNTGDFTIGGAIGDGNDSLTFIASGGDIVGGLGTVTANVLTLNASGGIGIGIGNAVTADATTYNLTTAGTNAAGNITLIDAGAFDTNQITTLVTHGSAQRIDLTANSGDLTVGGAIGQANDDLNLTAAAGNIVGGGAAVTANALTLDASGGIGIGMAVQANATSYSLKTTGVGNAGDIALVDTGAFNTNQVTMLSTGASAQTVSLTANTGDLTIGTNIGNAIDDLTLVATAGDIVGGVATTATAAMLTLDAGGGIGIGIAVTADAASYSLTTAGTNADGDITLIDTAALNTNQITTLDTDASAQTVSLTATTGDLTVGDAIGDATDSLTLIAAAGNVVGGAKATADMLTVTANGGIGTGPVLETDANTLNLTTSGVGAAGNIRVEEFDATTYVVNTHASAQLIQLTQSNGDITIGGAIGDGGDSLTFVASAGNIEGSGTTVTANALVLQAGGGIGTVTEITANAASYSLSTLGAGAAGNITLVDTNSLNTSQITNLSTGTTPQTVSLTASLGNLTVDAAIGDAGDDLSLNALVGNVEGGATATATNLTVQAGGGIGIGAVLNTNADTLNLTTSGVNGLGNITVVESDAVNLSITTVGSAQTVNARVLNGNLTISNPFGDANDNLTLITSNGDVVGGGTVTADTLTINSSGGIGNGIPLQTDANTLDLTSAGIGLAGNISVVQADAANLSIATDVSGQMISVTLTTGDFTVGGAIGDGNDSLMFAASDGNIIGGAGTVTANDLTLFASGGIGITTAVTANAATYNLETQGVDAAGNIELISVNTLNTDQITLTTAGSTQTIDLSVSAGDLIVGGAIGDSMDNLNLNTSAGNIVGGGATVSAATLTIVSAGGIGVGMALNTDASALNLTTNGADAAGNITVVENDAVALSINTAASTQTASVTVRNGNLTVGGPIGDSNDNLILITSNGDVNGGSTVTANNLTVNASGGIGIDAFLLTNANTILLTSAGFGSAGDITVKDVGSADFMIGTDASSQTIDLTTRTGDFNIGGAIGDVNDHLRFTAILGDINGGGTVTANSLTLSAGRGIGTVAAVRGNAASYSLTSSAVGAAGNISLVDTGPLNTSQITTLSTDGSSQTVTLTSETANLTVDSLIGDSNDDLTLIATAGDVIGGGVATAGTLRLVAAGGIGVGTALTADATTYELSTTGVDSAGNIALVHQGALNTSQLATLSTDASTQTISLTASASDLTVDAALHHANDNFELIASGGGVQNTGASVTANALSVDAITGINLNTSVTSFEAINRVGGDIQVTESDAVTILMVEQFSPGDVSISAGGTIDLSNGGRMPSRITSGSGSISLQAVGAASDLNVNGWVTSGTGQITLRADDDLALGAVARVTTGSNDAVSVTLSANDDGAGSGVLAFNDSAIVATDKGQISGVLVNSPTPISGTQVGELLGGTQRNAQIDVTVNDPAGLGFVAEVDWLEGNPGDSDPSRRNPLEKNISTGGVGVNFQHSYDVAPNQGDINVNVSLTSIADGSIVLRQNTTDLLDRPEFTTTVTLRVEGALLPFSAPLPEADNVDFVRTFEQIVVTTPATQRIVFVTPPLQFNNSVGSAVVTSQRYYVLRIVSFGAESEGEVKLWDSQPGREEYSLPDLEDPNSGEGFELSQLPELFKRLPDDRYRIYLIEGQTERLVLDFIIRDGQPIESQSDDQPVQESEATESDGEMDAEPAAGPIERPNLSSVERLGSVPVVSTGGIVLAAGMAKRDQRRHGRQWRNASAQPERDRNNMSARRPASWR
nr:hypothetical protein [Rhodopirellula sp. SM50]